MYVSSQRTRVRPGYHWIIAILLIASTLRALVPAGYMVAPSEQAGGVLRLTICSASGAHTLDVAQPGAPSNDKQSPDGLHQPCAFASAAANAEPRDITFTFAAPQPSAVLVARPSPFDLPPSAVGPILGSRAPPRLS
jgi:hypothetical protein